MTITSMVLGIATLGTPEAAPDCDCAFIVFSSQLSLVPISIEYDRTLSTQKNLLFSEALYEKAPRFHQHLLTLLRRQRQSDIRQHPSHTGEQQLKLRQSLLSRLASNKWQ